MRIAFVSIVVASLLYSANTQQIDELLIRLQAPKKNTIIPIQKNPFLLKRDNNISITGGKNGFIPLNIPFGNPNSANNPPLGSSVVLEPERLEIKAIFQDNVKINNIWYKVGEYIEGYRIDAIKDNYIVLKGIRETKKLFIGEQSENVAIEKIEGTLKK
jgi:hypothetical protein